MKALRRSRPIIIWNRHVKHEYCKGTWKIQFLNKVIELMLSIKLCSHICLVTSSVLNLKLVAWFPSTWSLSSTIAFIDVNWLVSFRARHSMSCICLCVNAIALSEQFWTAVLLMLAWGTTVVLAEWRLLFFDFLIFCLWYVSEYTLFIWSRSSAEPSLYLIWLEYGLPLHAKMKREKLGKWKRKVNKLLPNYRTSHKYTLRISLGFHICL